MLCAVCFHLIPFCACDCAFRTYRDGLERLQVEDDCTVGGLQRKIQEQLKIPLRSQILSKDQGLVSSPPPYITHSHTCTWVWYVLHQSKLGLIWICMMNLPPANALEPSAAD